MNITGPRAAKQFLQIIAPVLIFMSEVMVFHLINRPQGLMAPTNDQYFFDITSNL
jgi:hypothetical protein